MVVDPSAEIAGGGHIPHECIGRARRMLGRSAQSKYEVLQEAVTNHGPEVCHLMPMPGGIHVLSTPKACMMRFNKTCAKTMSYTRAQPLISVLHVPPQW